MSRVYFTEPIKINAWNEKAHVVWLDKIAAERQHTRQGILRQVLDGVMNFAAATPGALDAILGYASAADTPLRARKPKKLTAADPVPGVKEEPPKRKRGRPRKMVE